MPPLREKFLFYGYKKNVARKARILYNTMRAFAKDAHCERRNAKYMDESDGDAAGPVPLKLNIVTDKKDHSQNPKGACPRVLCGMVFLHI